MIVIGTRFWDARKNSSPEKIVDFVKRASELADLIIVAINEEEDRSKAKTALQKLKLPTLRILTVRPWGYTFAMNALIYTAHCEKQRYFLSLSVEVHMERDMLENLKKHIDDETLCVGARLANHEFYAGRIVPGTGVTVPWNTCCLWNLKRLPNIGFPLVGDASFDPTHAGIEEVTTIALHQHLYPDDCKAKLVEIKGIEWHTEFKEDPMRRLKHERKIRMKIQRSQLQLGLIGLPEPKIEHISCAQSKLQDNP